MITAKEARFRTENKKVMDEVRKVAESAVMSAIELGDFSVGVYIPDRLEDEGRDIIGKELEELGYKVQITDKSDTLDVMMIEW